MREETLCSIIRGYVQGLKYHFIFIVISFVVMNKVLKLSKYYMCQVFSFLKSAVFFSTPRVVLAPPVIYDYGFYDLTTC